MMRTALLLCLLAVAGCAATPRDQAAIADRKAADEIKLARLLEGYTPGPAQECIDPLFRDYHTTGCEGVENGDAQISQNYQRQLCRGQIIQTFDTLSRRPTGGCSLNAFIPYRKVQP